MKVPIRIKNTEYYNLNPGDYVQTKHGKGIIQKRWGSEIFIAYDDHTEGRVDSGGVKKLKPREAGTPQKLDKVVLLKRKLYKLQRSLGITNDFLEDYMGRLTESNMPANVARLKLEKTQLERSIKDVQEQLTQSEK